jgi:hypothetical protein
MDNGLTVRNILSFYYSGFSFVEHDLVSPLLLAFICICYSKCHYPNAFRLSILMEGRNLNCNLSISELILRNPDFYYLIELYIELGKVSMEFFPRSRLRVWSDFVSPLTSPSPFHKKKVTRPLSLLEH